MHSSKTKIHDLLLRARAMGLVFSALACGCAGTTHPVRWQEGMQTWFSNSSLDPDEPPPHLWTRQDQDSLLRLMGYADAVMLGSVRCVSQYANREAPSQVAIAFTPLEVLFDASAREPRQGKEIILRLGPAERDFLTAVRVQEHLVGVRYLLFLKKRTGSRRGQELRWALYRPRSRLLAQVRAMYGWLKRDRKNKRPDDKDGVAELPVVVADSRRAVGEGGRRGMGLKRDTVQRAPGADRSKMASASISRPPMQ